MCKEVWRNCVHVCMVLEKLHFYQIVMETKNIFEMIAEKIMESMK